MLAENVTRAERGEYTPDYFGVMMQEEMPKIMAQIGALFELLSALRRENAELKIENRKLKEKNG